MLRTQAALCLADHTPTYFAADDLHPPHLPSTKHPAQHALALVLSSGEGEDAGISQDEERALELFQEAARGE